MQQLSGSLQVFSDIWFVVAHGGWIVLVALVVYLLFILYMEEIQGQWLTSQEWVFLSVRIPKVNELSMLAVEQIFTQMHALATTITFAQKYVEGKFQLWYSLEIVSLGGTVSYIIRAPKKVQDLVEASFYAQYPEAEITEVSDYMENLEFHPGHSSFDIFGFEFKLEEHYTLPIKTYKEFEHTTAEKKIIDPLAPLFESLAAINSKEMYAVQILICPLPEDQWKPKSEAKAKELIEGKEHHESFNLLSAMLKLFSAVLAGAAGGEHGGEEHATEDKKSFMQLSDVEKERINAVLRKPGKPGYLTKIRHLYLAPQDAFDNGKKALPIGSYRTLGNANTNKLKPDTKKTWTAKEYKVSEQLERAYIEYVVNERKEHFFKGFKNRSMYIGLPPFVLNVEELATIYHLPLVSEDATTTPPVTSVESKKAQPPANLPIGEY